VILGLPIPSWLLLFVAVGAGLTLEILFYRARRRERRAGLSGGAGGGGGTGGRSSPEGGP
jgi:hypothetical protein